MNRKFSMLKSMAVAAALMASISGIARADDNRPVVDKAPSIFGQTNPRGLSFREEQALSSESPMYQLQKPVIDRTPSTFRETNPHGLSYRQEQAVSDESQMYQLQPPVINYAASTFRQTNPHGLSYGEYEARSNESAVWQRQGEIATKAVATTEKAVVAKGAVTAPTTTVSSN